MKKFIGFLVIIPFILVGAGIFVVLILAGAAVIWAAFNFRELFMIWALDKGMKSAEKLTGEKFLK